MNLVNYKKIVSQNTPAENRFINGIMAFLSGGLIGLIGEFLRNFYAYYFNLSTNEGTTLMIITLVLLGCFLTAIGVFDNLVKVFKAGLLIPITGFAHSIMSATLEYKNEGLVTGIGANMFKLAGVVIVYGIVSAYILGLIRLMIGN